MYLYLYYNIIRIEKIRNTPSHKTLLECFTHIINRILVHLEAENSLNYTDFGVGTFTSNKPNKIIDDDTPTDELCTTVDSSTAYRHS